MNYKTLYRDLAHVLTSLGCFICDIDVMGHCKHIENSKAFIYIKPSMNYQQKFFVLAHEAGHLFYMKKGNCFNWSKKARSEEQANWFALQLLRLNGIDSEEYMTFYGKAKKAIKTRKKAWFEI